MHESSFDYIFNFYKNAYFSSDAQFPVGVCYGTQGDNLPVELEVIEMYKQYGITKMRLFEPLHNVLSALRGSNIQVSLGIRNEDLPRIATDPEAAGGWVRDNVAAFYPDVNITYITVGNEVVPGAGLNIFGAITNIYNSLQGAGLVNIKVTTVIHLETLGVSFPPSQGSFTDEAKSVLHPILNFLADRSWPLMVNIYPYFAYASNSKTIDLEYALCKPYGPAKVQDGPLSYNCLADAMLDAFYTAIEWFDIRNVQLVISEIGWPSAGNGIYTTPELASRANMNWLLHALYMNGTPKRPEVDLETFFFAMFNENMKPDGVEQNFGLFNPDKTPVYPLF